MPASHGKSRTKAARHPDDERRGALRRYDLLDTRPDPALDDLTALAGYVCDTPIALISFVDGERMWFKSRVGVTVGEVPRRGPFTAHAIAGQDLLIVPDATQDERFANDPIVTGEQHIRFYAGAPLTAPDGVALGTLCVMDRVPRQLTSSQQDALRVLSRQVIAQLELKRQTRELVENEARLRIVTENVRAGLVVIDSERRFVYANSTFAEIVGLPSSAFMGQRVQDAFPDLHDEQAAARFDRAFAGERVDYEMHRSAADGEHHYAVRYGPAGAGRSVVVVVVVTEITAHKQAERATSHLAAIVESSADAIIGKDLDGIVTSWNRGAEHIFGYTAAEMVGTPILRLIPADRRHEEGDILAKIRRGEVAQIETLRQTKDGRLINVATTASPIKNAAGQVIGASKVARDISERKRAHEDRRLQQAILTTERELTLDGILVVDDQSRVLSFNGRFAKMWGVPEDILATRADAVLLQSVIAKLRHPDAFLARVQELYDRHDAVSQDEVELTDGRIFDRYSAPMRDPDGQYYGRVWYFRDVTAPRQAEAALRRERDRAQQYLDTAEVLLVALDVDGCITAVNRKACELLGQTEDELVGRDYKEAYIPVRFRTLSAQSYQSLLDGDLQIRERPVLTKSGEERVIEWRTTLLRDEAGQVTGTFNSGTDVTERNQAIEALRAAEERMRFALQSAEVGIWDLDYATGKLQWSQILETQYGLESGAFTGTFEAFIERVHPDDRAEVLEVIGKATRSGDDFSVQNRTIWPDGTVHWLAGAGRILLGEHGEPVRGVGISMDITERHSLEQQYHQAQKMEAIGRLAGGVAHDFNNLLTVILGFCDLARGDLEPNDPRDADLEEIQKAGQRAAALTRQLLAFSRKEIIDPVLLDLNVATADTRTMLERLIGEDVAVVLVSSPEPALIKADPGQVQQIIMNLAVNARDAMPAGGTLTIETANVELDEHYAKTHFATRAGPYVALTVTDTGSGMSPEVQARLFEPFFTTKPTGKGTGLGLATVHGIVTRNGGSIGVYSEVGRGTSFKVYFPRTDASNAVVDAAPVAAQSRACTETVLVVEDAEGLRDLTKRLLERKGYTVVVAEDADDAVRVFDQHPAIDVLLTDVVMPGASGPELASRLVEQRPALKVIYMSGYTEDAITQHGVLKQGIEFVHKPFTAELLGRKLREVLDREK